MTHIIRFNENSLEERRCLETVSNVCAVCGSDKVNYKMNGDYTQMNPNSVIIDYECDICNFKWYSEYIHNSDFITESGEELIADTVISDEFYNIEKIEAKKYNL